MIDKKFKAVFWDFGGVITSSPFQAFSSFEKENNLPKDFIRKVNSTNPYENAWAKLESSKISLEDFDKLFALESENLGFKIEGSKILENNSIYLNKLFDSFDDIHYLEETSSKICMSLHKFCENEKIKNQKKPINLEIKTGFFEKMFNLLSKI